MFRVLGAAVLGVLLTSGVVVGQDNETWDARRLQLTRPELELLLRRFEETGRSASYSNDYKMRAKSEAELVRLRLTDGDFQVGDQIVLTVEKEEKMPVTLTVAPGRVLVIPKMEELSLAGVLRSELNEKVTQHVSRFIVNPVVRTQSNVRVFVSGQIAKPGFHTVPSETILSDLIMLAGGPTGLAKLTDARIERGSARIWDGQVLHDAITAGRTLDQMSLQSGDQLHVPSADGGRGSAFKRAAMMIPTALLAITALLQIL